MMEQVSFAHAEAMAAIHAAAFPAAEAWSAAAFAQHLVQPAVVGWITGAGGFVLARHAAGEAEILTIAVCPQDRRQGLGGALLTAALGLLAACGAATVFLEVALSNAAARRLYASAGFTEVGRRARYYADGGDACVMRRDMLLSAVRSADA